VTGGCEALGYWDPTRALLLKTDPHRYPIWEGVAQLPGGCDMDYKFLMRMTKTPQTTEWEPCPNRQLRTRASEKAVILVTDPDNVDPDELAKQEQGVSNYFSDYTTLAAPYSSTVIFNTARPQEDFKEMLEDEAFQKPCGELPTSHPQQHPQQYPQKQQQQQHSNMTTLETMREGTKSMGEASMRRLHRCPC